jgi:hypothetical protein
VLSEHEDAIRIVATISAMATEGEQTAAAFRFRRGVDVSENLSCQLLQFCNYARHL